METTAFHGSRLAFSIAGIIAVSLCAVAGTYRLKKSAQLKYWEKALASYSLQVENENHLAKGDFSTEEK